MVDINQLRGNPEFINLDPSVQRKVIEKISPDFGSLSPAVQDAVVLKMNQPLEATQPGQAVAPITPVQQPQVAPTTMPSPFGGQALQITPKGELQEDEFRSAVLKSVPNMPESGFNFVKDLVTPLLHPVETAKSIGNLAIGAVEKLIPGEQDKEKFADEFGKFLEDRYGSTGNVLKTIETDPVGVIGDVATFVSGSGAALRGAGAATKIKKVSDIGQAISKAGAAAEPLSVARKITAETARKLIPADKPSKMFKSAAKFSTALSDQDRLRITNTALENAIFPTSKGLNKLRTGINEFNEKIDSLINEAEKTGAKIPIERLLKDFKSLTRKHLIESGEPIKAQRQINNIKNQLIESGKELNKKDFSPKELQAKKKRIYKETESYYTQAKLTPASKEAQQEIAKAAKESLEEIFPEIKELNQKEGALIELRNAIEKSSNRIGNRDFQGIGLPIKAGAGGTIGGIPGAAIGLAIALYDTPQVKSRLAIVANRLKRQGIVLDPNSNLAKVIGKVASPTKRQAAFQAGRITDENE